MDVISLGAGVQSSAMSLMAAAGEIGPMPECGIFADTQAEPASVYLWLDWLEKQLPFPIYRVTQGDLRAVSLTVRTSRVKGINYTRGSIPAFIKDTDGKQGLLMRQCTGDFKIVPIHRQIQKVRNKRPVTQWIGISVDEASRMKPSKKKYITNRWPLIELGLSREDCLRWMQDRGHPKPPRSACTFCPYHSNKEWVRLKNDEPEEFEKAVEYEKEMQASMKQVTGFRGTPFLHRDMKPLGEIDFAENQTSLFTNECEGICGV